MEPKNRPETDRVGFQFFFHTYRTDPTRIECNWFGNGMGNICTEFTEPTRILLNYKNLKLIYDVLAFEWVIWQVYFIVVDMSVAN